MLSVKLVVVGGDSKSSEVQLKLPTIIGRGREGVSLTLPHALVSRKHTEIFEKDGQLFVNDLGSLNGTFVNNERIAQQTPLNPNELLTLGNVTFRAVYEANTTSAAVVPEGEVDVSDEPVVVGSSEPEPVGAIVAKESGVAAVAAVASEPASEPVFTPEIQGVAPEKSVSVGSIEGLPDANKKAEFNVQLDGLEKPESVSQIELNLDETVPAPAAGDSKLGSFLKKMPR